MQGFFMGLMVTIATRFLSPACQLHVLKPTVIREHDPQIRRAVIGIFVFVRTQGLDIQNERAFLSGSLMGLSSVATVFHCRRFPRFRFWIFSCAYLR